jgi:hypothetical protein
MTMNRTPLLLLLALLFAPFAMAGQSVTRVSWESIDGSGPGRPTVSVVAWDSTTSGSSLSVKDPGTLEWIQLRHLGTKRNETSLGAMFVGQGSDGRRVQLTLIGKPYYAPTRFEYALTFTKGPKERMFYGNCNDELETCFKANR